MDYYKNRRQAKILINEYLNKPKEERDKWIVFQEKIESITNIPPPLSDKLLTEVEKVREVMT